MGAILLFATILVIVGLAQSPRLERARRVYAMDRRLWNQIAWSYRYRLARAALTTLGRIFASVFALMFVFGLWAAMAWMVS